MVQLTTGSNRPYTCPPQALKQIFEWLDIVPSACSRTSEDRLDKVNQRYTTEQRSNR